MASANRKFSSSKDMSKTPVYRGVKLPKAALDEIILMKQKKEKIRLCGFTSTSENIDVAIGFMF